jgi:ectoine hydroxylase-related dioxygenase (phytanoyl-CoA dioxygenase family)
VELETLPPGSDVADILTAIDRDGACIVRDALSPETLAELDGDVMPLLERTRTTLGEWSGLKTKRTGGLVALCPACRPVVLHPLVLAAAETFLAPYCERIQLNLTQLITILPGQGAQPLHRDRFVWGGGGDAFAGAGVIPAGVEPQFNAIYALTDFTTENGATHVVPGSHRWSFDRDAERDESIQADMARGSVLLYTGSVIHGGGENRSTGPRIGMTFTYSLGWLRQEENQYLSCPPEIAKDLPPALTDLLGYTMGNFSLGFCTSPSRWERALDAAPPELALGRRPRSAG